MPLSQSTPLFMWAFSLEHGVWHWQYENLTTANLANVVSDFLADYPDGVIVSVVADATPEEIANWEERARALYWAAEKAERNESPSVTALNGALDKLFGSR